MQKTFSFTDRAKNLKSFESEIFDLVIIGGGITGAGVARDAAMRGMSVALVEAQDFAQGTSSRSSKLVHGGIRYLENMEFKLVFEALSERTKLFEMAPHLVHPLRFMIPLYQGGRVGMGKMGMGMWLYDALSLFQAEMHERLDRSETAERMPVLRQNGLLGSFVYSDAYMDDDRLVYETLRSANQHGAKCANFVEAIGAKFDSQGKISAVKCEDLVAKKKFSLRGRHTISCVGAWTDQVGSLLLKKWKDILRPTKGVHLTFEKSRLPLSSAVVMGAEKRIVFGIPRHEMVIVGTTDTDFSESPEKVVTTHEDVDYLLGVVDEYFPQANISKEDIVASYAGVRPLVKDEAGSEGKTSREHTIMTDDHGITFVAGGKYTTYRLMAQQIVEEALKYFSIEDRVKFNRCQTSLPLNPLVTLDTMSMNEDLKNEFLKKTKLSATEVQQLVDRHGGESSEMLKLYPGMSYWEMEARHAIDTTMCLHLRDFYSRRAPLILSRMDHGQVFLKEISQIFADAYDWDGAHILEEQRSLNEHIHHELEWKK
jgi:glycerol-3-phosphate dehydrogenase